MIVLFRSILISTACNISLAFPNAFIFENNSKVGKTEDYTSEKVQLEYQQQKADDSRCVHNDLNNFSKVCRFRNGHWFVLYDAFIKTKSQ